MCVCSAFVAFTTQFLLQMSAALTIHIGVLHKMQFLQFALRLNGTQYKCAVSLDSLILGDRAE